MTEKPHAELLNASLTGELLQDVRTIKEIMYYPENKDIVFREFDVLDFRVCLIYVEGMVNTDAIGKFIIRAGELSAGGGSYPAPPQRAEYLKTNVIGIPQTDTEERVGMLVQQIMAGMSVLLIDRCAEGLTLETRGYERRSVDRTQNESVVVGSQEGFVENLRTNTTLMRRYVQTPEMVTEFLEVGTRVQLRLAIMYMKGVVDEQTLKELKRRLLTVEAATVQGLGQLQQMIEDHPYAILPQMLQTERPDRAASCIMDGQIVLFADNSPYALIAPVTVFHLLHSSDDTFLRWQYGTFLRIIRLIGATLSLFLPGVYIALTLFHPHLIPMGLLTAIAETRADVPFSILAEVLIMEASFYLINEAGTRIPSQIGSALGIVGALILGQAAVSASVISPILIIIIALTGLGNYAIPSYPFSLGIILYRLGIEIAAAFLGLCGIALAALIIFCQLCGMKSFGVDYFAPVAPYRPHNPDIILRLPMKFQKKMLFFAQKHSWMRKDSVWKEL